MKKLFAVFAAVMMLTACNTMQGLGQDVQKAGSAVEKAASK